MLIDKIKELEAISRTLETGPDAREDIIDALREYSSEFLDDIETRNAFFEREDGGRALLDAPISDDPIDFNAILDLIRRNVADNGLNPASPGHVGYIPGGGIYPAAVGDYLAAMMNSYAGVYFASPGAVRIENMLIKWLVELVGYPQGAFGNLSSGGSIANLSCIVTARDAHKLTAERIPTAVVYTTGQVHHSLQKALRIAGMAESQIRILPMDDDYRMDTGALLKAIEADRSAGHYPWLLAASAGTTDTGSIDPLDELAGIAQHYGLWYHVDAAYGGFFRLLDSFKDTFKGIERSDSLIIDPHKGLFMPYGLGVALVRDAKLLYNSHYYRANYMQDVDVPTEELNPADLSPELSKHFRGLRMWLPLKLHGLKPFRAALEEKLYLARYFYEKLQNLDGFEVGPYPQLTVTTFRYIPPHGDPNKFNELLIKAIHRDGRVFPTSTQIDGKFILRVAILAFRTHLYTVDLTLQVLQETVTKLLEDW